MGPGAVAILQGASLVTRSNDTEYPFRQDSDFHYLTGFDHPHAAAVFRTDGGPEYTLFVEPRDPEAETWNGYRPGVEGATDDYDALEAYPNDALDKKLPEILGGAERLFHQIGRNPKRDERIAAILDEMRLRSRRGANPPAEIIDPRTTIHGMRLFKEEAEVEIMRRAADISREAHHEAAKLAHEGHHEYELEAILDFVFRRRGAAGPAYGSIVGCGKNATILHYIQNDQPLVDGELLLIDAGCELEGYASDVTRTYPVGGRYEGAGREVYDIVLEAQLAALDASKPGATLDGVHRAALEKLTEGMISLGLLQGSRDECIEKESFRRYYMHGTSHWLGLDVHDVGTYKVDGEPRQLEPGIAYTVEPGLYVAVNDEEAPEALRGIGVRIEDNVVITPDGHENLTAEIPKDPAAIEAWVSEGR